MNTRKRYLYFLVLACFVSFAVFVLGANKEDIDQLREAERSMANGDAALAYRSYVELRERVSTDSPLRVAAWRGALRACPSGEALRDLIRQLLDGESAEIQRKSLSALRGFRLNDTDLDGILMDAIKGSDESVGVALVELLADRQAQGFADRVRADFFSYNLRVKRTVVESFPRISKRGEYNFLVILAFQNDKLNTEAAKSLALLADPEVDDYLIETYLRSEAASELDKALAIDLLRARGAVFCKSVFYGILPESGGPLRSALIRCLREWGDLEDLKTILRVMGEYEDFELRGELAQLFVSIANARVKKGERSTAILKRAARTADASLKALLARMEAAIK